MECRDVPRDAKNITRGQNSYGVPARMVFSVGPPSVVLKTMIFINVFVSKNKNDVALFSSRS